jgi:capsid assembly protease
MRTIIAGILAQRIAGIDADPAVIQAALVNRKNLPQPGGGAVAVIPIYGVIAPRMNLMSDMSGGTTFESLTAQLSEAMANKAVKTIVFDVDSPGGSVAGATEFAAAVREARTKKPIIAQAQYLMASAAYWPMTNATHIYASPSANIGSVGVYGIYEDVTEALAKLGVKQEVIAAGKYKAEAAGVGPLTDEQRGHLKSMIDAAYETFLGDISKGRGVAKDAVRSGYGEGRVLNAKAALAAGMIDGISTLEDTIARALSAPPSTGMSAHATAQELARATAQELAKDVTWQNGIEAALLELEM